MSENETQRQVENILNMIDSGRFDADGLTNLYVNASSHAKLTEPQREDIISAIELRLRKDFPRIAKKKFGPTNRETREQLDTYYSGLKDRFDLSNNYHKNGVKLGGHVIAGTAVIDDYISYRNNITKTNCSFGYKQVDHESPKLITVGMGPVGAIENELPSYQEFPESAFDAAAELFEAYLEKVISGEIS